MHPERRPPVESRPLVAIYADESCLGNGREGDNPGGAGGVIEYRHPSGRISRHDYWISEPATTNNRMALRSAIEALTNISRKGASFHVVFTSDSQYLVKGITEWVPAWRARGWRRKQGAIENLELWKAVCEAAVPHHVEWRWVRGHAGHPQNEYANHLATRAARDQSSSGGVVPSDFDAWIEKERAAGRVSVDPAEFPDPLRFTGRGPL